MNYAFEIIFSLTVLIMGFVVGWKFRGAWDEEIDKSEEREVE